MDTPSLSLPERSAELRSESVHLIHLPDDRRLAYAEFGDRTGYPLFYFHSHGNSRLEAASLHRVAKRAGFRIIAADRPGVGLSDHCPAWNAERFAADMEELAKQLRCGRYGLIASGGGFVTALEFAARSGSRASMLLGMSCTLPSKSREESFLSRLLRNALLTLLQFAIRVRHWQGQGSLKPRLQRFLESLSYADRQTFANPAVMLHVTEDLMEALRQGAAGIAADTALQFVPIRPELLTLLLPCHFWMGSTVRGNLRLRTETLVAEMPNASMHELANRGRYFYLRHSDEVFAKANDILGRSNTPVVHQADFAFRSAVRRNARSAQAAIR